MGKRLRTSIGALILATIALAAGLVAVVGANAATGTLCGDTDSTHQGAFVVMNNKWNKGAVGQQCIDVTANGFTLSVQGNDRPANHNPAGYPAIYVGCHYANCSDNSPFPRQLSTIGRLDSRVALTFTTGVYNASYDIWLDSTAKTDGVNQTEIMVWFNRVGSINPVGAPTGTATLGGYDWEVWTGNNGGNNVVTYVGSKAIDKPSFDTVDFIRDGIARDAAYGTMNWYLTSIQAGFEPWSGGTGLAVTAFNVTVTNKS